MSLFLELMFIGLLFWAAYADWKTLTIPDFIPQVGVILGVILSLTAPNLLFLKENGSQQYLNFKRCLPQWLDEQHPLVLALCLLAATLWILSELYFFPVLKPRRGAIIALRICFRGFWRRISHVFTLCVVSSSLFIGIGAVLLAHSYGVEAWLGLATALLGSLFGMLIIWGIRILASLLLRGEALGYGDVVFFAMIGSWLGWQATCAAFALAPIIALILVLTTQRVTGKMEFAFGPPLAIAAMIVRYFWAIFETRALGYLQMVVDLYYWSIAIFIGGFVGFCCLLIGIQHIKHLLSFFLLRKNEAPEER